jgi:hypothetical protein
MLRICKAASANDIKANKAKIAALVLSNNRCRRTILAVAIMGERESTFIYGLFGDLSR